MTDAFSILLAGWLITLAILLWTLIAQQKFFLSQIQTLVDKIKSSSFESYARAKDPEPRIALDEGIPEDLRALQEFTMQI